MVGKGLLIVFGCVCAQKWSLDPSKGSQEKPPEVTISPEPPKPVKSVKPDQPCTMASFMTVDRVETRRWCRSVIDLDRSKETTLTLIGHLMTRLALVGDRDQETNLMTLRIDPEIFDFLSTMTNETSLVVKEIVGRIDQLFLPVPVDDRNKLVRVLDEIGIDLVHFQIAAALTVVFTVLVTLRQYGLGLLEHFGFSFLIKYGFFLAWLVNIPVAYFNELEAEKAKWNSAKLARMPEGCDGQDLSTWTNFKSLFSWSQLKDPCEKWQQSLVDPMYKVSWLGVASQSAAEVIGPAFKVFSKNIRGSLDELLDGLGLYHQLMYTALTMAMVILFFMWISNFRFKMSGVLLGIEFGPREEIRPKNSISIEDIRSEFRKMGRELSIEMKSEIQQNQLMITSVENISSRVQPEIIPDVTGSGDFRKLKKDSSQESFEHISDEN